MKSISRLKLQRMMVKSNKSIIAQLRLRKTKMDSMLRQGHSHVINLVRGKGIDPYAAQMISFNVIPERQYQWFDHSKNELLEFIGALKIVPSLLGESGQMISVLKDNDVSCEVVWEAIVRILAMRGSGGNSLGSFMLNADHISNIELIITGSNNRLVMPRVGTIIFDKTSLNGKMTDHFKLLNASKTANVAKKEAMHILREAGRTQQQTDDFLKYNNEHIKTVISSYFQLETLNYHPALAFKVIKELAPSKRKGFLKLFDKDVDPERTMSNIAFLKGLFMKVPPNIILPTIVYHDLGKDGVNDKEHARMGAELFRNVDLKKRFGLDVSSNDGMTNKAIIMNSIRHHLVPGGLALGEYSFAYSMKFFNEQFMTDLLSMEKTDLFIDNLTLLTACDIAGYTKSYIPLNYRIESLRQMNTVLKNTLSTVDKRKNLILNNSSTSFKEMFKNMDMVNDYTNQMFDEELRIVSKEEAVPRMARILACDDVLIDKNTNKGLSQYIKALQLGIDRAGLSKQDQKMLLDLFSSVTDYSYSSRINSFFLWGKNIKSSGGVRFNKDRVNPKALRFFVHVAKIANLTDERQVKMMFVRSDGSPILNYNSCWGSFELLLEKINNDDFASVLKVTTEIVGTEKTIKIHLPATGQ